MTVMAVFGAPIPSTGRAEQALAAAEQMHKARADVNRRSGLPAFGLGIGITGRTDDG